MVRVKGATAASLYDEMEELEKTVVECMGRLKAAVKDGEAVVISESEHAEKVVDSLRANIAALEAKAKETEDTVHRKDSASQRMEKTLTAKINDLQSEMKKKEETLESRGAEVSSLTAKIDSLAKQVIELEQAVQQNKAEAASEAQRVAHLTESSNAKIITLEAHLSETEAVVRAKESTIKGLEQNLTAKIQDLETQVRIKETLLTDRHKEVNDLKSEVKLLTKGIKDMSSFFKQAEALADSQAEDILADMQGQNAGTVDAGKQARRTDERPATHQFAAVKYNPTESPRETVPPNFFDRVTNELSEVFGPMGSVIVKDHVASLGESIEKFPKTRVTELVKILSEEITDEKLKIGFRDRFTEEL
jgi:chromosome segregation ATPase